MFHTGFLPIQTPTRPVAGLSHARQSLVCRAVAAPEASQLAGATERSGLSVRSATSKDVRSIVGLTRELAEETESLYLPIEQVTAGVATLIKDPSKGRAFVLESHGEVVAQMQVIYEWSDWRNTNMWWITSVFVDSRYRRMGCFRRLYQHARQEARREGVAGIRVYTVNDNISAQDTYEAMGMHCHHKVYQEDL